MKRTNYPISPDFKKWKNFNPPLSRPLLPIMQGGLSFFFKCQRSSKGEKVERIKLLAKDGKTLTALLFSPKNSTKQLPCLVYFHGGGFVFPAAPYHYALVREYATKACCRVLFVNYRLAPKNPFPTAVYDCFSAYEFALKNAKSLAISPLSIAVGGDSAGGELASVVSLMAKTQGLQMPCAQMLIYPVVGRNLTTESMKSYTDTPMCNSRDVEKYDKYYIKDATIDKLEYSSPFHAESLKGLPPTYIETAEFDCLKDGALLFAKKLERFAVPVEVYNTKATMHGFDIALKSPIVRTCVDRRVIFLKKHFSLSSKA